MKPWIIFTPILISLLICIYILACQSQFYTPDTYTGRQLIVGNGGGFTGKETAYILLKNGQLFTITSQSQAPEFVKMLPKNISKELFQKLKQIQLSKLTFNHPGNIYYFIGIKDRHSSQRIVWGDNSFRAPTEAEELYQLLMVSITE